MAGITENGFVKKSFDEILNEEILDAKNLFGEDIDLRDETFLKQMFVSRAKKMSELWDIMEDLYSNLSISQATGIHLDSLVKFQGIRRKKAIKATVDITFEGTDNTIVPLRLVVQTNEANPVQFETLTSDTITGGSTIITCKARLEGADANLPANTITALEEPILGITNIFNPSVSTGGMELETDDSLRSRYLSSLAIGGGSTLQAIKASILSLESVKDVIIRENAGENGFDNMPGHSINPVVDGGDELAIQEAIYSVKSAGLLCVGALEHDFDIIDNDVAEATTRIGFDRPTIVDIWVKINLSTDLNYPVDGDEQLKDIVIDYINNLEIGQDLTLFQLSTDIGRNIQGITNLSIETSEDNVTYSTSDLNILSLEVGKTDINKVVII